MLCACQAIDLLAPLATSPALQRVHQLVRSRVPMLDDDRAPAPDIVAIAELIATNALEERVRRTSQVKYFLFSN